MIREILAVSEGVTPDEYEAATDALRDIEEQVSAYEDEINERTSDQALTLRKLREEQKKNAALEEQLETAEQNYARLVDSLAPDLLRNRIAHYIRDLEPVATSKGLANFLSAELLAWVSNPAERSDD